MDAKRIAAALDRIAAGVERLERVRPLDGDGTIGLRLTHLTSRHDRLKGETRAALAELDELIGKKSMGAPLG